MFGFGAHKIRRESRPVFSSLTSSSSRENSSGSTNSNINNTNNPNYLGTNSPRGVTSTRSLASNNSNNNNNNNNEGSSSGDYLFDLPIEKDEEAPLLLGKMVRFLQSAGKCPFDYLSVYIYINIPILSLFSKFAHLCVVLNDRFG